MPCKFFGCVFAALSFCILAIASADDPTADAPETEGDSLVDDATHVEIESIRIELGVKGKIETMAMDRDGRLLLGVSSIDPKKAEARRIEEEKRRREEMERQRREREEKTAKKSAEVKSNEPPDPEADKNLDAKDKTSPSQSNERPPPKRRPPRRRFDDSALRQFSLKIVNPETGEVVKSVSMDDVKPKMIHGCPNGDMYVCDNKAIVLYDNDGETVKRVELVDLFEGEYKNVAASGVTVCDKYFFVALGVGGSLRATEDVVRLDRDLQNPVVIVKKQFGCCAHLDLDVKDDVLLVAENSRHRVNRLNFEGEKLSSWGKRDRTNIEGFAACCNPTNIDFGPNNVLYTAESGVGRVKRYTADGEYLGLVGYVDTTKFDRGSGLAAASCYIPVEVSSDGKRIYVMDVRAHIVRVLAEKEGQTSEEKPPTATGGDSP